MEIINFATLEEYIYTNRLTGEHSVHGLSHWHQVEFNGLLLSKETGADKTVIRLFSLFHDSRRIDDGYDQEHGPRGAEFARQLRGKLFDLDDALFEKLLHACRHHTTEPSSGDPTIDSCYDADRLDLGRVNVVPSARKMATKFGKKIAERMKSVPVVEHRIWIQKFAENV